MRQLNAHAQGIVAPPTQPHSTPHRAANHTWRQAKCDRRTERASTPEHPIKAAILPSLLPEQSITPASVTNHPGRRVQVRAQMGDSQPTNYRLNPGKPNKLNLSLRQLCQSSAAIRRTQLSVESEPNARNPKRNQGRFKTHPVLQADPCLQGIRSHQINSTSAQMSPSMPNKCYDKNYDEPARFMVTIPPERHLNRAHQRNSHHPPSDCQ